MRSVFSTNSSQPVSPRMIFQPYSQIWMERGISLTRSIARHRKGATAGAGGGAVVGGAFGLLMGMGALVIPGVGPVLAAGPVLSALVGAGAGATVGGLAGALIGMGMPEYEAIQYEEKMNGGNILISVHTED